jgi:glycosyltransferase involved in cell wall biosynthesis
MIDASGIGTAIKGWLGLLLPEHTEWRFVLLGDVEVLSKFAWADLPHVTLRGFAAPIYSLREQWEWFKLRGAGFDLLWVPHFNIPYFWPGRLMVTVHDVIFLAMPELFSRLKIIYARLFLSRIRDRANGVIFVSRFTSDEFTRLVGSPLGRAEVIHNVIDPSWFAPAPRSDVPARFADKPYIACVGNVKPHKNLRRLILAYGQIADQIPHRLLIIGRKDGFLTGDNEVEGLAASLTDRIVFTGFVSDAALHAIVAHADLLVHPSLYEGFGYPPLEAMAAGCPVAIADIPPLREMCGDAAVYFNPADPAGMAEVIRARLGVHVKSSPSGRVAMADMACPLGALSSLITRSFQLSA